MLIKILVGTFGLALPNGGVRPITKNDGPVEVSDQKAQSLINLGIAKAVVTESAPKQAEVSKENAKTVNDLPDYSKQNTKAQLLKIAKVYGVDEDDLEQAETKADIIALIDAAATQEDAPMLDAESALE